MTEADLQIFTDSVRENQQRLMANNFVPLSDEDVHAIYCGLYNKQ
jgi:4-hydroxybutyrate dehydrogenase